MEEAKIIQLNPKPELKKEEIFPATVNARYSVKTKLPNGMVVYPNETELRTDRLGMPGMIWMDELIDKNCKACYGTGRIGYRPVEKYMKKAIGQFILENIDRYNNSEMILFFREKFNTTVTDAIITTIREMPTISRAKAVIMLVDNLEDEIRKNQPVFCGKCLIPNYRRKVIELKRLLQFK